MKKEGNFEANPANVRLTGLQLCTACWRPSVRIPHKLSSNLDKTIADHSCTTCRNSAIDKRSFFLQPRSPHVSSLSEIQPTIRFSIPSLVLVHDLF